MAKKPTPKTEPKPDSAPDRALAQLADARRHWDALLAAAADLAPNINTLWKTYSGASGRQCVLRVGEKNLAYLKPADRSFLVSMALSDDAVASLAAAKLPKALVDEITAAKKYPEGRPARVTVSTPATLKTAKALLAIKLADVRAKKAR
jgi:hypothetical protein